MKSKLFSKSIVYGGAAALILSIGYLNSVSSARAAAPSIGAPVDKIYLVGTVLDFQPAHTDFNVVDPGLFGHYVKNVGPSIGSEGVPVFVGGGCEITHQWYDRDDNPISPYGDAGLFGGHFDVDVFNRPSTKKIYHEHEYDDKFDVTYVDIANDSRLLFDDVVGADYPNDLRVVLLNTHNGGGGTIDFYSW